MKKPVFAIWVLGLVLVTSAQVNTPRLTMDKVMTPDELRATGVATLTAFQRVALDNWLRKYTERILRLAPAVASARGSRAQPGGGYHGVGSGHWITEKSDDGAFITLEDGSLWEINSVDQVDTALWLPITNITVLESQSPVGKYKYLLIDTDDGEKALAKYLGQQ